MRNVLRRACGSFRPSWALALAAAAALPLLGGGCSTPLGAARRDFYAGRFERADQALSNAPPARDKALYLMERGTIRQARGAYPESARDYIAASDELARLQTYSVSKGATSLVINDNVQDFSGVPYERTLLHAFTAHNHLALADWDNAAVEARRIITSLQPEHRGTYPEDAYSRYVAGFCLEMIDDDSNAALQYSKASALAKRAAIKPATGRLTPKRAAAKPAVGKAETGQMPPIPPVELPASPPAGPPAVPPAEVPAELQRGTNTAELVCFILAGRLPAPEADGYGYEAELPVYAEIRYRGQRLGRSHILADTAELASLTAQKEALRKAAKTATRVVIKKVISHQVEQKNESLGVLTWLLLLLLEQPDTRCWETLPRWLEVARVNCPADLKEFDVVFKTPAGTPVRTLHVTQPIQRRRNILVAVCRDLAPAGGAPPSRVQSQPIEFGGPYPPDRRP